jgi:hypothetical protein
LPRSVAKKRNNSRVASAVAFVLGLPLQILCFATNV